MLGGRRLWPDPGALSESSPRPGLSAQGPLRRPPALGGVGAPVPLQQARLPLPAAEEGLRAWTRHCIFITKLPGEITATAAHLLCCRKACFSPSFFISWCIVNAAWASAAWLLGICGGSAVLGVGRTWPRDSRWAAAHRPPSRADHEKGNTRRAGGQGAGPAGHSHGASASRVPPVPPGLARSPGHCLACGHRVPAAALLWHYYHSESRFLGQEAEALSSRAEYACRWASGSPMALVTGHCEPSGFTQY